jgi:hypothetical protein
MINKTTSPAARAAASVRLKEHWADPAWREKQRRGIRESAARGNYSRWKSEMMTRIWADPSKRESRIESVRQALNGGGRRKIRANFLALKAKPEFEAKRARLAARAKRGFDVPPHLREEYKVLRLSKRLSAQEAGRVLGLINNRKPFAPAHFFDDSPAPRGRPIKYRVKHLKVGQSVFFPGVPARKLRASIRRYRPMKFETRTVIKGGVKHTKVSRIA